MTDFDHSRPVGPQIREARAALGLTLNDCVARAAELGHPALVRESWFNVEEGVPSDIWIDKKREFNPESQIGCMLRIVGISMPKGSSFAQG